MKPTAVTTLAVTRRAGLAGRHIVACGRPAEKPCDALVSGNGDLLLSSTGDPARDHLILTLRGLQMPQWAEAPRAPLIADKLPLIREMILDGRAVEAAKLSSQAAVEAGVLDTLSSNPSHPAIDLILTQPVVRAEDYLFTLDLRTSLVTTRWRDGDDRFVRELFASRADGLAVLRVSGPAGRVSLSLKGEFHPPVIPEVRVLGCNFVPGGKDSFFTGTPVPPEVVIRHSVTGITLSGAYAFGWGGFFTAVRAVVKGGRLTADDQGLHVEGADAVVFLMASSRDEASLVQLDNVDPDFDELLARHVARHRPMFERLSVDLGGDPADYLLTGAELKQKQFLSQTLVPAYVEMMVDRGRFFLLNESGEFPPICGHVNINVNHQVSGGSIGALPEMMDSFFRWIENQLPDARDNAQRLLGTRGFFLATHPDEESGRLYHFNEYYPHHYWISSSGWCLQPFLEHYQCTGDLVFLKERMIPLYKELFLLYEDFLTLRDGEGKRTFVPSYSPENFPGNVACMAVVNAAMDISVCREVLETLLTYAPLAGAATADELKSWRGLLDELPPYLFDGHGELKEWAWEGLAENYDHRHSSHLYGAYPSHEFQPDVNAELFHAARIANRMRAFGNESFHGIGHRAQAAARLKDPWLFEQMLRLTLEAGYVCDNFTTVHNPYLEESMPDAQGALPTMVLEALFYSRPGVIEPLPALPNQTFPRGSVRGIRARTFAVIDELSWNLDERWIALTLTSLVDQVLTMVCRWDFEEFSCESSVRVADSNNSIRLTAGKAVRVQWSGIGRPRTNC